MARGRDFTRGGSAARAGFTATSFSREGPVEHGSQLTMTAHSDRRRKLNVVLHVRVQMIEQHRTDRSGPAPAKLRQQVGPEVVRDGLCRLRRPPCRVTVAVPAGLVGLLPEGGEFIHGRPSSAGCGLRLSSVFDGGDQLRKPRVRDLRAGRVFGSRTVA